MLTNRAKYATRALLELSLNYDRGPIQAVEIGEKQNIPVRFLEQILMELRRAGFVQTRKGPGGGYFLARAPKEITLGTIVRAMDGPIAPISCVSVYGYAECGCPQPETCGLRVVFKEARDALANVLDGTSFEEIRTAQSGLENLAGGAFRVEEPEPVDRKET